MFGLFKKQPGPSVTEEDKEWIEESLLWLVKSFGTRKIFTEPFLVPTYDNFPYDNGNDETQFQRLFEQLCEIWGVNSNEIRIKVFDNIKSKQWTDWMPQGKISEPAGVFYQGSDADKEKFTIELAKSTFENLHLLIAVVSHELAHVKLLGGEYLHVDDAEMELLTDLSVIFWGFGIFMANSCETRDNNWVGRTGYLPNEVISYTNALLCYASNSSSNEYAQYLNTNTKSLFIQDYEYLKSTGNTSFTKHNISESENWFKYFEETTRLFDEGEFEKVIELSESLISIDSNNHYVLNNLGYAQLLLKEYDKAIKTFDSIVDIDPYWDFAYNNRGYCRLQLGDLESAYIDIKSSIDMNPVNSFAWRNMGVYYFFAKEYEKAIEYFEKAQTLDPETELIHFYLGKTHLKLGNEEVGNEHLKTSKQRNEYNDSVID